MKRMKECKCYFGDVVHFGEFEGDAKTSKERGKERAGVGERSQVQMMMISVLCGLGIFDGVTQLFECFCYSSQRLLLLLTAAIRHSLFYYLIDWWIKQAVTRYLFIDWWCTTTGLQQLNQPAAYYHTSLWHPLIVWIFYKYIFIFFSIFIIKKHW